MPSPTRETTELTLAVLRGEAGAAESLLPHVYDELHSIADRLMRTERAGHTLRPTELIHEAYLRLVDADTAASGVDPEEMRVHFLRTAARAMRFVLVDHARRKFAQKRGGARPQVTFDGDRDAAVADHTEVLQVHEGLEVLAGVDERLAQIVEMRFFGGLSLDEVAVALKVSRRTVVRDFRLARAWWLREFGEGAGDARTE